MLIATKAKQARVSKAIRIEGALILETENGILKLQPVKLNIIRIVYTMKDAFSQIRGLGIEPQIIFEDWEYHESPEAVILETRKLKVVVNRENSAISYFTPEGRLLTTEPASGGKELIAFDSYKTILDETAIVEKIVTPDGIKEVVREAKKNFDRSLFHTRLSFKWGDGEALYGLGQQEEGCLNLRGTRQYIHQANMKIAMPFLMSTRGYGILVDTYAPLIFNDNAFGSYIYSEASEELDFYFISGDQFDEIIGGYRTLTGTASMLPLWAFGLMQSQERFESQAEILETVARYRDLEVPLDSIVLDWQSWEEGMWGQKSFDASRFPNPIEMTQQLHENGAHFMISIWPNMVGGCQNHKEMAEKSGLFQRSEIYNAFDEKTRGIYWNQANNGLFSKGVDAWWCDSSEPFTPEWNNHIKPEPDHNMMAFHDTAKIYMDEAYTNAYPFMHAKAIYEGQRGVSNEKRVVNLTRSGYIGQQKFGTILWSGDTCAKWKTLKNQVAAGLNYCASGLPYWTMDIGAFFVKKGHMWFWDGDYEDGTEDLGYRELYTRWYQLGAFLPIFRAHGTDCRREIWNFGCKGERFYDAIESMTKLRYRLMPYIYSLAGMVTLKDSTMLRLLAFDFLSDAKVYDISDQFMFGPSLMVCPVLNPMYFSAGSVPMKDVEKTRMVYLPEGADWYDFWSDRKYVGGQNITASAPIDKIPLYVKAGSIIPMTSDVQHTGEIRDDELIVVVYPGKDGHFTLYQDERNNYNYEKGEYTLIELEWVEDSGKLMIGDRIGRYSGMPEAVDCQIEIKNGSV